MHIYIYICRERERERESEREREGEREGEIDRQADGSCMHAVSCARCLSDAPASPRSESLRRGHAERPHPQKSDLVNSIN